MSFVIKVVLVGFVLLVVAIAVLRIRKLRRDENRQLSRPVERRLMSPPPSPYAPSKGFRLLDGPLDPTRRPEPPRPRLEADRDYVFSEAQMSLVDDVVATRLRHNEEWALSRSARRSTSATGLRVGVIALAIVVIVAAIGFFLQRGTSKSPAGTTTTRPLSPTPTTSPNPTPTRTSAFPSSIPPLSRSDETAPYHGTATTIRVVVIATGRHWWVRYWVGT